MADLAGQAAFQSARQGLSANKAYTALHAGGLSMARGTFLKLYAEAKNTLASMGEEPTKALNARPRAHEIHHFQTTKGEGYLQQADIWVQDRETGEVYAVPFAMPTETLLTRGDVLETGLDSYRRHAEKYGQRILTATYSGTYLMAPPGATL